MWDSINKLSLVHRVTQLCIVIAGLFSALAHWFPHPSTSFFLPYINLFIALSAVVSFVLTYRIRNLEKAAKKKDQEIIVQLEQKLEREAKKKLPVIDSNGKAHYLPLEVPPEKG